VRECNIENMTELVEALESGKYTQIHGQLRARIPQLSKQYGFCCLGVACDISKRNTWVTEKYSGKNLFLPATVSNWLGVEGEDIFLDGDSASTMNDNGKSFKEIAKAIRKEYLDG